MTPAQQRAGALESIERIVNRGGADDDVVAAVRAVLAKLDSIAADDAAFANRVEILVSPYSRQQEMRSIFRD
jgi:hypothetical protein